MICIMPDSLLCEGFGMPINGKWCAVPWKMTVIHFPPFGKRSPWQTYKLGPKTKNYLACSSLCCHFANPKGIDQSSNIFSLKLKSLYPSDFLLFSRKVLNIQTLCMLMLNSIMTSNSSKWALPVVNILIMLITSCDSIDSLLQQHLCLVPRAIVLTFCRKLCTSPWPFLRKVLNRIFTTHLHPGCICMGPESWSAPFNTYFDLSWGVFLFSFKRKHNTLIIWKEMKVSLNISRAVEHSGDSMYGSWFTSKCRHQCWFGFCITLGLQSLHYKTTWAAKKKDKCVWVFNFRMS